MIKLLWRFGLLIAAAIAFAWLADRPGHVTINWLGREIQMSVLVGVTVLVIAIGLALFIWRLLQKLWRSPSTTREYLRFRKQRKAYHSLSRGIIAAGAGDAQSALQHARIAGETLKDEPLVTLLSAQAAQLKGDRAGVKRAFEDMTKSPDTELLGLRGLFAEAKQSGDWEQARKIAERALVKNPRLPWASTAILQVQITAKDWAAAASTIANQAKYGILPKAEAAKKQAAMLTAHALGNEQSNPSVALNAAIEAHRLDESLVPAAAVAARVHLTSDNYRKAAKILRATWALAPHPELVDILSHGKKSETEDDTFERVRDFVGKPDAHIEHACALARAAINAKRFDVAKQALLEFSAHSPQARICALMAEIEEAQGEKAMARDWLGRALYAARDPIWVSDGVASLAWSPISPVTGEIVPCDWKPPFEVVQKQLWQQRDAAEVPMLETPATDVTPSHRIPVPDDPGIE